MERSVCPHISPDLTSYTKISYEITMQAITARYEHVVIPGGDTTDVVIGVGTSNVDLWVRRDVKWILAVTARPSRVKYPL